MTAPQFDGSAPPSLSDAINKLMANPEIISMVASTLGNMSAKTAAENEQSEPQKEPSVAEEPSIEASVLPAEPQSTGAVDLGELMKSISPVMSLLGGGSGKVAHSKEADSREALLCALKPYVSEGRREAIDYIIRISQVSDLMKNMQNKQ